MLLTYADENPCGKYVFQSDLLDLQRDLLFDDFCSTTNCKVSLVLRKLKMYRICIASITRDSVWKIYVNAAFEVELKMKSDVTNNLALER